MNNPNTDPIGEVEAFVMASNGASCLVVDVLHGLKQGPQSDGVWLSDKMYEKIIRSIARQQCLANCADKP